MCLPDVAARHGVGKWRLIQKDAEFSGILATRSNVDLKVHIYTARLTVWLLALCSASDELRPAWVRTSGGISTWRQGAPEQRGAALAQTM